jgi:aquaporin Z
MYKYLIEFLGTLLFVGTISFSGNPLLIISSLAVAIALGGKISGGHFNPAVSTWAWMSSKLPSYDFGMYVLAQTSAAALVWLLGELTE